MITLRPAAERGRTLIGWLDSRHTFSFGEYFDPDPHGLSRAARHQRRSRRAGGGFPTHGHADMEILSYVLEGGLAHQRQHGHRVGDPRRRRAADDAPAPACGTASRTRRATSRFTSCKSGSPPTRRGLPPGYEQKRYDPAAEQRGRLRLVGSPDGREARSRSTRTSALYAALLGNGEQVEHRWRQERCAWVQVARGTVELDGQRAARRRRRRAIVSQAALTLTGTGEGAEVLVFDLA